MPTVNSYMDKIFRSNVSQKSFRTIDRQKEREAKIKQMRSAQKEPLPKHCNWRLCDIGEREDDTN